MAKEARHLGGEHARERKQVTRKLTGGDECSQDGAPAGASSGTDSWDDYLGRGSTDGSGELTQQLGVTVKSGHTIRRDGDEGEPEDEQGSDDADGIGERRQ